MRGPLLFLLTAATLATVPSAAQKEVPAQQLHLQPEQPRQGDALFVRLREPSATRASVQWRGEQYPLYRQGDLWKGAVAVTPDTPASAHTLSVSFERDGQEHRVSRQVRVSPTRYSVQRLKMAPSRARLYNFPGAKREDAAISAAIRTRSQERWWKGEWSLPTRGRTSTPFGVRRLRNGRPVGRHRGLDIAAPTGTDIRAPAGGRVVLAAAPKEFKKYGGSVVLDHGQGLTSLYIHMSQVDVKKGQTLTKGTRLGSVGEEGVATGPHLHWAVYVYGDSLDPLFFTRLGKRGIAF